MRHIFISLLVLFSFISKGQQVFDTGFEYWPGAHAKDSLWVDNNYFAIDKNSATPILNPFIQFRARSTTDANSGQFAARLNTSPSGYLCFVPPPDTNYYLSISGLLCLCDPTKGQIIWKDNNIFAHLTAYDGIPFTQRIQSVDLYYKYFPTGNDSCAFAVNLYKWNNATQKRDTVGHGFYTTKSKITNYTFLSIPIQYFSSNTPDTIGIVIASSFCGGKFVRKSNYPDSSKLFIDDIRAGAIINGAHFPSGLSANVIPNPASDFISVQHNETEMLTLTIYNAVGSKVQTNTVQSNESVSVDHLPNGLYYCSVTSRGGISSMQKLSIKR